VDYPLNQTRVILVGAVEVVLHREAQRKVAFFQVKSSLLSYVAILDFVEFLLWVDLEPELQELVADQRKDNRVKKEGAGDAQGGM